MQTINMNKFIAIGMLCAVISIGSETATLSTMDYAGTANSSATPHRVGNYVGVDNVDDAQQNSPSAVILRNHRSDTSTEIDLQCGGTYRGRQTTIESPQFPNNYPSNVHCEYLFISPFVCRNEFHFQFLKFALESSPNCAKDNVTIGDVDVLCGSVIGIMKYSAERGALRVLFSSDAYGESEGFRIVVTRLPCVNENPAGGEDFGYGIVESSDSSGSHTISNDAQFEEIPTNGNGYTPSPPQQPPINGYPMQFPNAPVNPQQPGPSYPNPLPSSPIYPNGIPIVPNFVFYPQFQPGFYPPSIGPYSPPPNCPQPNQPPFNHPPPNIYPLSPVPGTPSFNVPQYPIKTDVAPQPIVPSTNPAPTPGCCLNSFNTRRFFLVSPGFPNAQSAISTDCLYYIERNNPNICRLRIELKYFFIGSSDSRFGCFDNFIELDGRRICGCNTGLVYTSQWGVGPKTIRFVNNNNNIITPEYGVKGFVLDIIQEECPFRLSEDVGSTNFDEQQHSSRQSSAKDSSLSTHFYRRVPNIEFGTNGVRNVEKASARFFYPNTDGSYGGRCIFNYTQWLSLAANQFWLSKPVCIRA